MKRQLLVGVSALAVGLAAGGGIALADITQTVTNSAAISSSGNQVSSGEIAGTAPAAQIRVGATGALTAVSATAIESGLLGANLEEITQTSTNTGAIETTGGVAEAGGNIAATGGSVSVAATGAAASMSETIIGATDANLFERQNVASLVDSSATNSLGGTVTVSDSSATAGVLTGDASSLGVSASGAGVDLSVASFASEVVGSAAPGQAFGGAAAIDEIAQSADNAAAVSMAGAEVTSGGDANTYTSGGLNGSGASAAASVTGASANVRNTMVDSSGEIGGGFGTVGGITQDATNSAAVSNSDATVLVTGDAVGSGTSASIGATGAAVGVGVSSIVSSINNTPTFGAITQGSGTSGKISNTGAVSLTAGSVSVGELSGAASSVGASANGAVASVFERDIGSALYGGAAFDGAISSTVENTGTVTVDGPTVATIGEGTPGTGGNPDVPGDPAAISGNAASASISAGGALVSVSSTSISGEDFTGAVFGDAITQRSTNTGDVVIEPGAGLAVGDISGNGARANISAVGASAGVSALGVNNTDAYQPLAVAGTITQTATQSADKLSITEATITSDDLSGAGAGVSIAATGASASISGTVVDVTSVVTPVWFADAAQTATNTAAITVADASITSGALTGAAASAGISTVGASATVGVTAINSGTP